MPTIRVDDEVMQGLKQLAEPFVDTPSSVIRRLLEQQGVLSRQTKSAKKISFTAEGRPQSEALTPQSLYAEYLLATLERDFQGRGDKRSVTQTVIEKMRANGLIGPLDLELVATGETKAENSIAWARNALKERGYISRISPRGTWELTAEGRAAAKQIQLKKPQRS